jgi:hypothetical protein
MFSRRCPAFLWATAISLLAPSVLGAQTPASPLAQGAADLINADRPGIADGSRTIGGARVQLETALQIERHRDDGLLSRDVFVPTLLRIGLSDRWELRVEGNTASWMTVEPADAPHATTSGFAPISAGVKYAFYDSHAEDRRLSAGAIVRVFPPSGSGSFHASSASWDARLVADKDVASRWSVNPNIGIARYASASGGTFATALAALTLNYEPSATVNPFVDFGWQSASDIGAPGTGILDAGVAWIVRRSVQLDVSVGDGIHGPAPRPFVAAGVSIRSGRLRVHRNDAGRPIP